MVLAGLTGGIGSGKSTLAALLAERGAQIIDADQIGRDVVRTGEPGWHSVVAQFGREILAAHTLEIDRARLGSIVFSDPAKLVALNAIVHPLILQRIAESLERLRPTDAIVVLDAALIVELGLAETLDLLIVVEALPDIRRARLVRSRGMRAADVDARIAAQAAPEELRERADIVVRNDGTLEHLAVEAERVWRLLTRSGS
ncbi:MAG: dephospho-CoA kinase [Actinomycetota bacterium]|nr:dephospho-CoA kinase [Actinomycetota bacterium]